MKHLIYIADDEKNIRELIKNFLESDGYSVEAFETGDKLLEAFRKKSADLVILDIMMPGTDGLAVCRILREETDIPIIILSARDSDLDYVQGITIGGDDYLVKPFRPTELLMHVRSLLRRMEMNRKSPKYTDSSDMQFGNLIYKAGSNTVTCKDKRVELTQTEFKMLIYMMADPDKAFSRKELLEAIWGYETEVETRVTDETMRRLRKKLLSAGSSVSIQTVWGFGYKLDNSGDKK